MSEQFSNNTMTTTPKIDLFYNEALVNFSNNDILDLIKKYKNYIFLERKLTFKQLSSIDNECFILDLSQNILYYMNYNKFLNRNKNSELKYTKVVLKNKTYTLIIKGLVNAKVCIKSKGNTLSKFKSQGLFSDFRDMYKGAKKVSDFLNKIPSLESISTYIGENKTKLGLIISNTMFGLFSLHNILTSDLSKFNPLNFVSAVLNVITGAHLAFSQSQTVEILMGKIMSLVGVPNKIKNCLSFILTVTSEQSIEFFMKVLNVIFYMLEYLVNQLEKFFPESTLVKKLKTLILSFSYNCDVRRLSNEIVDVLKPYYRSPTNLSRIDYREKLFKLYKEIKEHENFSRMINDNNFKNFKLLYNELHGVINCCESYNATGRPQPGFIILEGQAGCGKSTIMNMVTKIFESEGKTMYSHVWKTALEGKDFYDDYNNQDIMVLDDIGQGGNGQWAKTMYFVSPSKYPLDCAAAEKKNTKFFTSSLIIGTTNRFMNITDISKDDGIADKEALFRRPIVFKCTPNSKSTSNEKLVDIQIFTYDYEAVNKVFINDYHRGFREYLDRKVKQYNLSTNKNEKVTVSALSLTQQQAASFIYNISVALIDYNKEVYTKLDETPNKSVGPMGFLSQSVTYSKEEESIDMNIEVNKKSNKIYYNKETDEVILPYNEYIDDEEFDYSFSNIWNVIKIEVYHYLKIFKQVLVELSEMVINMYTDHPFIALGLPILIGSLILFIYTLRKYILSNNKIPDITLNNRSSFKVQGLDFDDVNTQKSDEASKYMYRIIFKQGIQRSACIGLFSGKYVLTTRHSVIGFNSLDVYKNDYDLENNSKILENMTFKIIYEDKQSDLIVLKMNLVIDVFKKSRIFFNVSETNKGKVNLSNLNLVSCNGTHYVDRTKVRPNTSALVVSSIEKGKNVDKTFAPYSGLYYNYSMEGLCGAILFDDEKGFIGAHVAGSELMGFVSIPSLEVRNKIALLMNSFDEQNLNVESLDLDSSGSRLRYSAGVVKPVNPMRVSSLVKTGAPIMYGVKERVPPIFINSEGKSKVKEISLNNLNVSSYIDPELVNFAVEVIKQDFTTYKTLNWYEVIKGNSEKGVPPLNMDSVNGYDYKKIKEEYIDFENGEFKNNYLEILEKFGEKLLEGNLNLEDIICYHALKDELRPHGKEPRTFSVLPLHITLWTKKLFGNLAGFVKSNRHTNGVAIGLNPYKEWDLVWKNLTMNNKEVFDGDVKGWDKSLPAQLLEEGGKTMIGFNDDENDRKRGTTLINYFIRTVILLKDELYLTTHGMQSGCWLTAFLNSTVNKMISACCFKKNYPGKDVLFKFNTIVEYFLGDDRISGVPKELVKYYNMITLDKFFKELGMELTDGKKNAITIPTMPKEEVSFLKRKFIAGNEVNNIFCPLSKDTLGNLFSYVDGRKDLNQVMSDRSIVFQIEKYLHKGDPDLIEYEKIMKEFYKVNRYIWRQMTEERIKQIINSEDGYSNILSIQDKYTGY